MLTFISNHFFLYTPGSCNSWFYQRLHTRERILSICYTRRRGERINWAALQLCCRNIAPLVSYLYDISFKHITGRTIIWLHIHNINKIYMLQVGTYNIQYTYQTRLLCERYLLAYISECTEHKLHTLKSAMPIITLQSLVSSEKQECQWHYIDKLRVYKTNINLDLQALTHYIMRNKSCNSIHI